MRHYNLANQLVVVTGASRGIGFHTACAFHEVGARVVITGRDEKTLEQAAANVGSRCRYIVCDQQQPEQIEQLAHRLAADFGPPRVLVANAGGGFGAHQDVVDLPLEKWRQTIDTNLTGTFLVCKHLLPAMMGAGRGDVFLISSMSGKKGDGGSAAYAASKFGLQGLAQSLNHEVRRRNIRVMVLNPSAVNTDVDSGELHGPGLRLHAADLGALMVHLAQLPGRTLVRDMDIWGTNPFN